MGIDPVQASQIVKQYGFPTVAAVGMSYFVYFIYKFVTGKLMPLVAEVNVTLIALIDRIRMLDNDLIRLQQKVSVVLQMKEDKEKNNANKPKAGSDQNSYT